jgi:hypothetical protein
MRDDAELLLMLGIGSLGRVTLDGVSGRRQAAEVLTLLLGSTEHGAGAFKVVVNVTLEESLLGCDIDGAILARDLLGDGGLPLGAVILDLLLVIQLGVIGLADAAEALPQGQVLGVDGDAVVVMLAALADVPPAALLLLQIQTGSVGEEEQGQEHAGQTEPGDDVETLLDTDVRVENGGQECAELPAGSRDAVRSGADGGRVTFGGHDEGDGVRAELVEEGGEEVHGLEGVDVLGGRVVLVVECGDHEEDEVHQEANLLHPLPAVELVVDQERGEVVSHQRDADVEQVVQPAGQDGLLVGQQDADEL